MPVSALPEWAGITALATNICRMFLLEPSHARKQPLEERALPHEVEVPEDSAFLLTIAWPEDTTKV